MDLLSEVQQHADTNGDGKLTVADFEVLKEKFPDYHEIIDRAKLLADQNSDGKVDIADIKSLNWFR